MSRLDSQETFGMLHLAAAVLVFGSAQSIRKKRSLLTLVESCLHCCWHLVKYRQPQLGQYALLDHVHGTEHVDHNLSQMKDEAVLSRLYRSYSDKIEHTAFVQTAFCKW